MKNSPFFLVLSMIIGFFVVSTAVAQPPPPPPPPHQPVGAEFYVNQLAPVGSSTSRTGVALNDSGRFVVVWASHSSPQNDQDGSIQAALFNTIDGNDSTGPLGQFQVNQYTTGSQVNPAVASDADNFVVVWEGPGIRARQYPMNGGNPGDEFPIGASDLPSYTTLSNPDIAMDSAGDFTVVWQESETGGDTIIKGQRYAAGTPPSPLGAELTISGPPPVGDGNLSAIFSTVGLSRIESSQFSVGTTYHNSTKPAVRITPDGRQIVALWESDDSPSSCEHTSDSCVKGQRYLISDGLQGNEFQVNQGSADSEGPSVAIAANGEVAVAVWESPDGMNENHSNDVWAQLYDSNGMTSGNSFIVNQYTTGDQSSPMVEMDDEGDFVVVWQSDYSSGYGSSYQDLSGRSVQGRRFTSNGVSSNFEFQVNTYTTNRQSFPAVTVAPRGDGFVVAWQSEGAPMNQDQLGYSVQAQRYTFADCSLNRPFCPAGSQFQINTYTTGNQGGPDLSSDADGDFVVVWQNHLTTPTAYEFYAQRFHSNGTSATDRIQVSFSELNALPDSANVASTAEGDFAVVWATSHEDQSITLARRFTSDGGPVTGLMFNLISRAAPKSGAPAIAMSPGGSFIVAWESGTSDGDDDSGGSIQSRRFLMDDSVPGISVGQEFQVNTYTTGDQSDPGVAISSSGKVIAVWQNPSSNGEKNIRARLYDWNGPFDRVFEPSSGVTTGGGGAPSLAVRQDGSLYTAYTTNFSNHSTASIRNYNALGQPLLRSPQIVGTGASSDVSNSMIELSAARRRDPVYVRSAGTVDDGYSIHAWFLGKGNGKFFPINSSTTYDNLQTPSISMNSGGDFVVAWQAGYVGYPSQQIAARQFTLNVFSHDFEPGSDSWSSCVPDPCPTVSGALDNGH